MKARLTMDRCGGSVTGANPDWISDPRALTYLDEIGARLSRSEIVWPRITVVTPSYNYARYIEQTIASVRYQCYPNLEYIICDNFSDDGTQDILSQHDWIDVRIEKDKGQADALNRAFASATGDILTWLNADDFYAPMTLFRIALDYLKGGADLIAGQVVLLNQDGPRAGHLYSLPDGPILEREIMDLEGFWLSGQYFYQPEVFFSKDIYQRAGGYVDDSLFYSMDYDLWRRMAGAGATVRALANPVVFFREHDDQKTNDPEDFKAELRAYIARQTPGESAPPRYEPFRWTHRRPRVALINDLGFQYGAGIAHGRIARAFGALGSDVTAFSLAADVGPANYTAERAMFWLKDRLAEFQPDVIVLGNLHAAEKDHGWLQELLDLYPIFFVTHDFYWLSGGNPYPADMAASLEDTPVIAQETGEAAEAIADLMAHPNAYVLANSAYAYRKAEATLRARGMAAETKVRCAELGFETDAYFPDTAKERNVSRAQHGLPLDKSLILFACANWVDQRKNPEAAIRLANLLDPDLFHPVFLGRFPPDETVRLPEECTLIDFTREGDQVASLFRAVDFVFTGSQDETFGQTVVEGALCGAIPVSMAGGAVPEILAGLNVGFQVPAGTDMETSLQEIAQFMTPLAQDPDRLAGMRITCAMAAAARYSIVALARRLHLALKTSGLIHDAGLMPKADICLKDHMPELHMVPPMDRNAWQSKIDRLEHRVEELEGLYEDLLNSRSMRLTAPMRRIRSVIAAMLGR